ncbi:hypothetical protein GCM10010240_39540 [Streptomyces griseoviridis]|nr:hypothetical protein GCM10010240_39540 [Streptomyces griseoviridis]
MRTAAVGQRNPEEAAAEDLDYPAAGARHAEGGGEHLLQFIAGPSAVRVGVRLRREVRGETRRREVHLPTACVGPLLSAEKANPDGPGGDRSGGQQVKPIR